jgi:chromate transport protein ChrA
MLSPARTPGTVLAAAAVQAAEALGVLIASAIAAVDTASGRSYHLSSGIAITIIGVCVAALLGLVALGLRRASRWSRTPAVLTQLFVAIVAIYLLQARRYDWGIPAILFAAGGFATLLAPASLRVLTPGRPDESQQRSKSNAGK